MRFYARMMLLLIGAALVIALTPLLLPIIYIFGLGNRRPGVCACGYDLRGLPAPRCPECGAAFGEPAAQRGGSE